MAGAWLVVMPGRWREGEVGRKKKNESDDVLWLLFFQLAAHSHAVKCYLGAPSWCSECEPQLGHMPCRSVPIGPTDRPVTSNTSTAT